MEHCPTETWTQIFALACTDGGKTACLLSSVSRYFRNVILPIQLQNVALSGPTAMANFAQLLETREPTLRRVKHLYLSRRSSTHSAVESGKAALRLVLTMTAPELLTLTNLLPQTDVNSDNVILCVLYPKLRELTIHGYFGPRSPFNVTPAIVGVVQPCFPSLKYLHVLTSNESADLYTSRAPSLTHLRLSALASMTLGMFEGIAKALDDAFVQTHPESAVQISSTVQRIVIQRDDTASRVVYGRPARRADEHLVPLVKSDKHRKLTILEQHYVTGIPTRMLHFEMWQDRLLGGPGCWAETSKLNSDDGRPLRPRYKQLD